MEWNRGEATLESVSAEHGAHVEEEPAAATVMG